MRTLFAALLCTGLTAAARGQDAKLKVGDPAPPVKATKWLQGAEVKEFAKDHVYVVEFWATWCGPCIVMMPHMGELQAEYKGKVTLIGFSAKDPSNTEEKVAAFVAKRGPKLGYTFAYADDRETNDAWMKAAGRNGIPCCFVVGKDGKIAYIGHPMYLDVVLPKVVDGKWGAEDVEGMKKVEADVTGVFKALQGDAEAGLKAVAAFDAKHPQLTGIPYFVGGRLGLLLKTGKFEDAKVLAEGLVAKGLKLEDPLLLRTVATALRSPAAKDREELAALAAKAAEAVEKLTKKD